MGCGGSFTAGVVVAGSMKNGMKCAQFTKFPLPWGGPVNSVVRSRQPSVAGPQADDNLVGYCLVFTVSGLIFHTTINYWF